MSSWVGRPVAVTAGAARDPVADMMDTSGERSGFFYAACGVALAIHVAMLGFALAGELLKPMREAMADNRARVHEFFWRLYDVELAPKPKEEKPPEPPPEPEPEPVKAAPAPAAHAPAPKDDDPYKNLPAAPTPAQAAKVLVQAENPDEPKDLTANTVVTGEGSAAYGQQSGEGKGNDPTMSRSASLRGVPGGRGTATAGAPPPPAGPDLSRPIGLSGSASWNCPMPPEAEADQIDQAVVTVQLTVRPDGSAASANVVSDPGHGFGRAARQCALAKHYQPAMDRSGTAILSSIPVNIRFTSR